MQNELITVDEAFALVMQRELHTPADRFTVASATGMVSVEDVFSAISLPPFNQSNFDGYAFCWQEGVMTLHVKGEVAAGAKMSVEILPGEAVRIFTGAAVPAGADTIVMQEQVSVAGNTIHIHQLPAKGNGMRAAGSDVQQGELILPRHSRISPPASTLLAMAGVTHINVYRKPSVGILITGNELVSPGAVLPAGSVYEANSAGLQAACNELGVEVTVAYAMDQPEEIQTQCAALLKKHDVMLTCGGVSVGDYDFVPQALKHCGFKTSFHGVKQKPGKPLLFGYAAGKPVFGLPGNPGSAITCFYYYVRPLLLAMQHLEPPATHRAPLLHAFNKISPLTQLMRAFITPDGITLLQAQDSYRMQSYYKANALAIITNGARMYNQGEAISYLLL